MTSCLVISNRMLINPIVFFFRMDFNTSTEQVVGMHEAPIKCVEFCPAIGKT